MQNLRMYTGSNPEYKNREDKIHDWMEQDGVTLVMFENSEKRKDSTIRWLCGFAGYGLLFLSGRTSMLIPWDLAEGIGWGSTKYYVPYTDFDRDPFKALTEASKFYIFPPGAKVEIPEDTPYPLFLKYVNQPFSFDILCREESVVAKAKKLRVIKDSYEIEKIRKAADVTNIVIDLLERRVREGKLRTEADIAMFIDSEGRKRDCEGTSFETLVAGAKRSNTMHSFPTWTYDPFGGRGLSFIDFGLRYRGYGTDVTLTFVREPDPKQEKLVKLVESAYKVALSMTDNGVATKKIAAAVDASFGKHKRIMPHSLGHGIGLDAHEYPIIRNRKDNDWVLEPGMVFTIEPGLYDHFSIGGCRLENDILMTETGPEVLTNARIIRL